MFAVWLLMGLLAFGLAAVTPARATCFAPSLEVAALERELAAQFSAAV